jgi:hypothetical protein
MKGLVFRSFAGQWRILSGSKRTATTAVTGPNMGVFVPIVYVADG